MGKRSIMSDWVVTIPKTIDWSSYRREVDSVADYSGVLNYRVHRFPKGIETGDRCFVVWNGCVRGWMLIVGVKEYLESWTCTSTGKLWPAGKYIQRSGEFHETNGPMMKGFRGIRRRNWE